MYLRYTSTWTDRHGSLIKLNIYSEEDHSVEPIKMGPTPFSVSDNTDINISHPIRYGTGYIDIVDEGNISDIMKCKYVTLKRGTELLWQGYIQPQQFGRDPFVQGDIVSIPVIDIVGHLDSILMDDSHSFDSMTFGELICEAISASEGQIENIVFPGDLSVEGNNAAWAKISVSRKNYFSEVNNDDEGGEKYDRISYMALLSSIAHVLGWVLSVNKVTLFLSSMTNSEYYTATMSSFENYSNGSSSTIDLPPYTNTTTRIESLDFMGNDNTTMLIDPMKKIKVVADSNAIDNSILSLDITNEKYVRVSGGGNQLTKRIIFDNNQDKLVLEGYRFRRLVFDPTDTVLEQQEIGHSSNIDVPYMIDNPPIYGYLTMQYCKYDSYLTADLSTKWKYNYSIGIAYEIVLPSYQDETSRQWKVCKPQSDILLCKVKGDPIPITKDGCFDIYFTINDKYFEQIGQKINTNSSYKMYGVLKVGNKYWKGENTGYDYWTTSYTKFEIVVVNGEVKRTKTLSMPYDDAEHLVAEIDKSVSGPIEFSLYANAEFIRSRYPTPSSEASASSPNRFFISNLSVKYCNVETNPVRPTEPQCTYISSNTESSGTDSIEVNLNVATKTESIKQGYGILQYGDDLLSNQFGDIIENILVNKLKTMYFSSSKQQLLIDVDDNNEFAIGSRYSYNGKTYYVISRVVDSRDSTIKVTLQTY